MTNRRTVFSLVLLLLAFANASASAQNRVIVRDSLGEIALSTTCLLLHCTVNEGLDGPSGTLYLVTGQDGVSLQSLLAGLLGQLGVVDVEPDQLLHVMQATAPSGLYDTTPVSYYGTTVWHGYAAQPAVQIINLPSAQAGFNVSGAGIVGVIDTGVDPTHPVLQGVLLQGRDFTRNQDGGSEMTDLNQSTMAVVNGGQPYRVNQSTMAVVNSTGSSTFSQPQFAAFGHGTMVSGIVHLVAPTAQIMPLKSFRADGTGYLTDVLKAIYYGSHHGANVLSMSFDFTTYSPELNNAVTYATNHGIIGVAGRARRRRHYDLPVWHVRRRLGHLFQHTVRIWHCRPSSQHRYQPQSGLGRAGGFECDVYLTGAGLWPPRYLPGGRRMVCNNSQMLTRRPTARQR